MGVNILLLWGAVIERGYPSQGWLTFKQALAAGGCVRKGERGTSVVYADCFTPRAEQEHAARDSDEPGKVAFLAFRYGPWPPDPVPDPEIPRAGASSDAG